MPNTKKNTKTAVNTTFDKLKAHFEAKKVDEWQKKWLSVPENRKKYESISDAPEVAAEEMISIANDIIDFAQGEETGKSHIFSKVKGLFVKTNDSTKSKKTKKTKKVTKK